MTYILFQKETYRYWFCMNCGLAELFGMTLTRTADVDFKAGIPESVAITENCTSFACIFLLLWLLYSIYIYIITCRLSVELGWALPHLIFKVLRQPTHTHTHTHSERDIKSQENSRDTHRVICVFIEFIVQSHTLNKIARKSCLLLFLAFFILQIVYFVCSFRFPSLEERENNNNQKEKNPIHRDNLYTKYVI